MFVVKQTLISSGDIINGRGTADPYIRPGDVLICEITLMGTDYKDMLYAKLDHSNSSTGT